MTNYNRDVHSFLISKIGATIMSLATDNRVIDDIFIQQLVDTTTNYLRVANQAQEVAHKLRRDIWLMPAAALQAQANLPRSSVCRLLR